MFNKLKIYWGAREIAPAQERVKIEARKQNKLTKIFFYFKLAEQFSILRSRKLDVGLVTKNIKTGLNQI